MNRYWCELAWLGGEAASESVLVGVDGESIASVAAGVEAPDAAVRLPGLTLPGFANSHSHCFQRALRGRTEAAGRGSFWTWREQMYALAQALDEPTYEALARATFAEMALAGITLVGEFDYIHYSHAAIRAAAAAGIRITLIDACYLEGGLARFRDASAAAWAERVQAIDPGVQARLGVAVHSVRAVDPGGIETVAALAAERGWPLHAHVSEQPAENEECLRRYHCTPLELLGRAGALSPRFTAVHATHFNDADAWSLAEAEAFCCLCPTTERDLADGIGRPTSRLTLGSDSQSVIDIFEEARAVELDRRLATGVRGSHSARELLLGATANGHASLGWPEAGRIEAGAPADLVTVSLAGPRLAGTRAQDALPAVVFAASREDISSVVAGGRQVVRDGAHLEIDVAGELHAAIAALP